MLNENLHKSLAVDRQEQITVKPESPSSQHEQTDYPTYSLEDRHGSVIIVKNL